jgi:hypothetical protein
MLQGLHALPAAYEKQPAALLWIKLKLSRRKPSMPQRDRRKANQAVQRGSRTLQVVERRTSIRRLSLEAVADCGDFGQCVKATLMRGKWVHA